MKQQIKTKEGSLTKSLLKGLESNPKANAKPEPTKSLTNPQRGKTAELDQDAGGGYNADGTYPQL